MQSNVCLHAHMQGNPRLAHARDTASSAACIATVLAGALVYSMQQQLHAYSMQ